MIDITNFLFEKSDILNILVSYESYFNLNKSLLAKFLELLFDYHIKRELPKYKQSGGAKKKASKKN